MASDVNFKLRFEISNLNYPGNYVYVVLNTLFGGLRGHEGLQMTSEVATDLKFEISGLNNPCSSASLASIVLCLTNLDGRKDNIIHRPAGFAAGKNAQRKLSIFLFLYTSLSLGNKRVKFKLN